jgi:hypothetical protein
MVARPSVCSAASQVIWEPEISCPNGMLGAAHSCVPFNALTCSRSSHVERPLRFPSSNRKGAASEGVWDGVI